MPSTWTRNTNETAYDWLERLRAVNREDLDASYRPALDDFIRQAEQTAKQEQMELESEASLGPAKDAYLRLTPGQREQFRRWIIQIEQAD
jgi:hypothetical protein